MARTQLVLAGLEGDGFSTGYREIRIDERVLRPMVIDGHIGRGDIKSPGGETILDLTKLASGELKRVGSPIASFSGTGLETEGSDRVVTDP